jgi:methyl-accepting chemotaxis protein
MLSRVSTGAGFAHDAGEAMADVKASAQRVASLMSEIMVASEEQSRGVCMVHQAVGSMDSVTQQNAALVEEATAAAHSLDAQAGGLRESVARFRLTSDSYAS